MFEISSLPLTSSFLVRSPLPLFISSDIAVKFATIFFIGLMIALLKINSTIAIKTTVIKAQAMIKVLVF